MNFREAERKRMVEIRDTFFGDPGGGDFQGRPREFVLSNPILNLWEGIRDEVLVYFSENQIVCWGGQANTPTGHVLSSQIACINHLFPLRHNEAAATAVLKRIHPAIESAAIVDNGFVEFEVIGSRNYLGERSHTRGANATSTDAVMLGQKADGNRILVLIEWKYTETYASDCKYIPARSNVYDPLLADPHCPIRVASYEPLYYEPFYQLMRQTLLGWKMVQHDKYDCDEYIHLHIIPTDNHDLQTRVTSPGLVGENMSAAWKSVLVEPDRYRIISPSLFMAPLGDFDEMGALVSYLNARYGDRR